MTMPTAVMASLIGPTWFQVILPVGSQLALSASVLVAAGHLVGLESTQALTRLVSFILNKNPIVCIIVCRLFFECI